MRFDNISHFFFDHVEHISLEVGAAQDLPAFAVNDFTLVIHHIVIFNQVFTNIKMIALNPDLRLLNCFIDDGIFDRDIFAHTGPFHKFTNTVTAETPHNIVFQRNIETRAARIALTPGSAAQLVIDTASLVAFRADDMQPARLDHLIMFFLPFLGIAPIRFAA